MKIFSLCCVRDAADIIGVTCAYHLAIGFERLIVVDDGSTDGTGEILWRLAHRTGRIDIMRNDAAAFDQGKLTSAAAGHAYREMSISVLSAGAIAPAARWRPTNQRCRRI